MSASSQDSTIYQSPSIEHLNRFCTAVREKQDWESKILDEKLALKWAIEAELTAPDSEALIGEALEAVK